jgi:hypothetical protein
VIAREGGIGEDVGRGGERAQILKIAWSNVRVDPVKPRHAVDFLVSDLLPRELALVDLSKIVEGVLKVEGDRVVIGGFMGEGGGEASISRANEVEVAGNERAVGPVVSHALDLIE